MKLPKFLLYRITSKFSIMWNLIKGLLKKENLLKGKETFSEEIFDDCSKSEFFKILGDYISDEELITVHNAYFKRYPDGNYGDLIWSLFNKLVDDNSKPMNYGSLERIHYSMALFLMEHGKNGFEHGALSRKYGLMDMKQSNVITKVEISCSSDASSCDNCKSLDKKRYSLDEALRLMPIPHKECKSINYGEFSFCRCLYIGIPETNEEMIARWDREDS